MVVMSKSGGGESVFLCSSVAFASGGAISGVGARASDGDESSVIGISTSTVPTW